MEKKKEIRRVQRKGRCWRMAIPKYQKQRRDAWK
jgi:hypothetical protein